VKQASAVRLPGQAEGSSLSGSGRPYWHSVARIGVQVAEALAYANGQGVLHRDVKPSNLLLDTQGNVWVTDFGLAKAAGSEDLTHTGDLVGTLRYLAPERFQGQADVRSDVYALGLTLYELLTLRPAFDESDRNKLVAQVMHAEPPRPRQVFPEVPRDLETVVLKAIDRDPARRYQTATELAQDLQRYAAGEPIRARRVSAWSRVLLWARRRPAAAALVLVSSVAALALVGVVVSLVYSAQLEAAKTRAEEAQQRSEVDKTKAEEAQERLEALQYRHYIDRAHAGLKDGNLGPVEALLKACPVEQRRWEWQYLKRQCHAELLTFKSTSVVVPTVTPNATSVVSAVSPDGTRCAFAGQGGTVTICDATTAQEICTLKSPNARLGEMALSFEAITYSPDGARLALTCGDKTIRIWNATTGQELHVLEGLPNGIASVIFSPDGRRLASGDWREQVVRVWDMTTGRPILPPLKAPTESAKHWGGAVCGVAFSPDGARLAAAILEGSIHLWDVRTGRWLRSFQADTFEIWGLAFSPDGTRLASGGADHKVKIWDVDPGRAQHADAPLFTFPGHTNWLNSVAFSPDGARIASGSADGIIKIWVAATGEELASFTAHAGMVTSLRFSPDGARLFSNGGGGPKVWDATTDQKARLLACPPGQSFSGKLSPDGKRFAFSNFDSPDHTATVLDATTGQTVLTLKGHTGHAMDVVFSPDGKRLATTSSDRTVKIWDAETGQEMRTLTGHTDCVTTVAFSPDGQRLTSASWDKTARVWDLTTGQEVHRLQGHKDMIWSVTYSPDGTRIATGAYDNVAKVWNAVDGQELYTLEGHAWVIHKLAFSPDGKWLASASFDQTVKIWDVATGTLLRTLRGNSFLIHSVAFTRDGKRLASACRDGTVKIWDPATEEEALLTLPFHTDSHPHVTFSPDGGQLFLATGGRVIQVFDARPLTTEIMAEREALGLLNYLFSMPLCKADVLEHLSTSPTITPEARQMALELVKGYQEESDPERYYKASWALLRQTYLNAFQYRYALRQAETACRLAPWQGKYQTALGLARYRNGKYLEALDSLTRAEQQYRATAVGLVLSPTQGLSALNALWQASQLEQPLAAHLAFLAMTQQQLGQTEKAQTTLEQLRQMMAKPEWVGNAEAQSFLRQAEALVRGRTGTEAAKHSLP
jgi:WD40 repeat protein